MFNLPSPKLGNVSAITITSPDLEKSLQYYQKLGFQEVQRMDVPFPWLQVSDGALLIMLIRRDDPYIALTYYIDPSAIDTIAQTLEQQGIPFSLKAKASDIVKRYIFQTPDKQNISLVANMEDVFKQPPGPTMLRMEQADYTNPEKYINKICGMFGEFAHPVTSLERSLDFWQKLGFIELSKFTSPYPWAIISDGLNTVGLHQTDKFPSPAITYFASDMQEKIQRLKNTGIEISQDMGPANIVLRTPEGQQINLFKLGM